MRGRYGCLSWVQNVAEVLPWKLLCCMQYCVILFLDISGVYSISLSIYVTSHIKPPWITNMDQKPNETLVVTPRSDCELDYQYWSENHWPLRSPLALDILGLPMDQMTTRPPKVSSSRSSYSDRTVILDQKTSRPLWGPIQLSLSYLSPSESLCFQIQPHKALYSSSETLQRSP